MTTNEISEIFAKIKNARNQHMWLEGSDCMWSSAEAIRSYLYSFSIDGSDNSFIKPYVDDALARFFTTIDLLNVKNEGRILEIGGNPYLFTILLKNMTNYDIAVTNFFSKNVYEHEVSKSEQVITSQKFGQQYQISYQELNVELSKYPYDDNYFDTILFCEVMEHIVINPFIVFSKFYNILKPQGRLVLTTPNAIRLINFAHMIAGKNFFDRYHEDNGIYGRHNREFTLSELIPILENHGFKIVVGKTVDRYNYDILDMYVDSYEAQTILPWKKADLYKKLEVIGASLEDRGDNIYIVAEKQS